MLWLKFPYQMNHSVLQELDEFNYHATLSDSSSDSSGISLVFFTGPHCASCHYLRDLFLQEKKQFIARFSAFNIFEVKADKAAALVNEFNVFHLPTMFLYRNGQYHCELQSHAHPQKIIEAIELALEKEAEEEP